MPTNQEFEDIFRKRFDALEETPPANAWEKIRQEIKPKPKGFRVNWLTSAVVVVMVSAVICYLLQHGVKLESVNVKTYATHLPKVNSNSSGNLKTTSATVNSFSNEGTYKPAYLNGKQKSESLASGLPAYKASLPVAQTVVNGAGNVAGKAAAATNSGVVNGKKVKATKVVWVVTVNPKSSSVEKVSTAAASDSLQTPQSN